MNAHAMIDAGDKCILAWLAERPPRQERVARTALNGHAINLGTHWDYRVDALMRLCKIKTTAKTAKLQTEVCNQGKVIEASVEAMTNRRRLPAVPAALVLMCA